MSFLIKIIWFTRAHSTKYWAISMRGINKWRRRSTAFRHWAISYIDSHEYLMPHSECLWSTPSIPVSLSKFWNSIGFFEKVYEIVSKIASSLFFVDHFLVCRILYERINNNFFHLCECAKTNRLFHFEFLIILYFYIRHFIFYFWLNSRLNIYCRIYKLIRIEHIRFKHFVYNAFVSLE